MSQEIYAQVTKKIVEALKEGAPPWRKPWVGHNPMPINAQTKRPYNGINVFTLWMAQEINGYTTNLWGTREMWDRLGGSILAGQRPTDVYLFRRMKVQDKKTHKNKVITIINVFDVYNLDQIWGCPCLREKVQAAVRVSDEKKINFLPAEMVAESMDVDVVHKGVKAIYSPLYDRITLPPKTRFKSQIGYWNTRFHEMVHATGHEKRLDRCLVAAFGTTDYAYEELIAEIGTAFVCSLVGIPEAQNQMPHHASYIASWLTLLQGDVKAIFKAASMAQKAADFIMTGKKTKVKADSL